MAFQTTDERRMLAESLSRYLQQHYDYAHRLKVAYEAPFHDPSRWSALSELGTLAALAPEAAGGFGGEGLDIATVFEALGHGLCPEPVLPALMGLRVLLAAGQPIEAVLEGRERLALALGEPGGGSGLEPPQTEARMEAGQWRLSGRKSVVWGGGAAHRLIVSARHSGGIGLFEVAAEDAQISAYPMIDGGGAAEITMQDTAAQCLLEDGAAALADAVDHGLLALCAEAVGAMAQVQLLTADYLRTRKQFGTAIGRFQVLRHRFVDLVIEIEQARSITFLAASRMDDPALRGRALSMAKALVGKVARQVAEETIQMHGGIGMTWEAAISHYAKRLVMIDHQLGDSLLHLERVAQAYRAA